MGIGKIQVLTHFMIQTTHKILVLQKEPLLNLLKLLQFRGLVSSTMIVPKYQLLHMHFHHQRETGIEMISVTMEDMKISPCRSWRAMLFISLRRPQTVNNCLKIAEDIREDAANTLVQLHHQGEQINRTHMVATEIDHDLSRGEKLLGNLGGMFSRTWKPKKNRDITGPLMTRDDSVVSRSNNLQQWEKLRLNEAPKRRSQSRTPPSESADAFQRVEFEKSKQDDGLSDLSDLLGDLKNMAIDMGNELERQNKALDSMEKDIDEINDRVNQANRRTRRVLGK